MINILIVDDHPVVLNGTRTLLQEIENWHIEIEENPMNVEKKIREKTFLLFLIDINMKPINGIKLAENIKTLQPSALIIFYTGFDLTDYYELLLNRKADGLLSKTATKEQVIQSINAALRNEIMLPIDFIEYIQKKVSYPVYTPEANINEREKKILQFVSQGLTNKAIAVNLKVSQRTVENHLSKIFNRLNVHSRAETILIAKERGWIE
ncbi:response regulator transcription factor [Terribacillus saccharophilus]|uniref:DNA-binding response regulator n=1 Tax=Terribacillus saccharophilus TaxID=361277 RepID=A0A268AGB6_9BACI|nr:response regulator transcription factor [Terribacillus saccharophilus]PAD23144.1 DNA-binding response regulator [Terribacillus saccharophilus]